MKDLQNGFTVWGLSHARPNLTNWLKNVRKHTTMMPYIDDFAFALEDTESFIYELTSKYKFKLKGIRTIKYSLVAFLWR